MKNQFNYILALLFSVFLLSCEKECDRDFTIIASLINGTTMQAYTDTAFVISTLEDNIANTPITNILASGKTDSNGNFLINYQCTQIGDRIRISMGNRERYLPKNQNIVYRKIYFSDSATISITFKTNEPLKDNQDTLFWAYKIKGAGTYKSFFTGPKSSDQIITFKVPVKEVSITYSRNEAQLNKLLSSGMPQVVKMMEDDPVINQVFIDY